MRRHLLVILVLLSLLGCGRLHQQRGAHSASSTPPLVQSAVRVLRDPHTVRLEVLWVPKQKLTRMDLTPQLLERTGNRKTNDSAFQRSDLKGMLIDALQHADIRQGSDPGDLRWACIFYDRQGARVLTMYFDGEGTKGLIQSTPVTSNGEVVRALERHFGLR